MENLWDRALPYGDFEMSDDEEVVVNFPPKRRRQEDETEERSHKRIATLLQEDDWVVLKIVDQENGAKLWEGPYKVVMMSQIYVWVFDKEHRFIETLIENVRQVIAPLEEVA